MVGSWGQWRPFPNEIAGLRIEAPEGPGLYELRRTDTGELAAFGHAESVVQALTALKPKSASGLRALFAGRPPLERGVRFEYRTCSAANLAEAKSAAERLRGRRGAFWRKRLAPGWA